MKRKERRRIVTGREAAQEPLASKRGPTRNPANRSSGPLWCWLIAAAIAATTAFAFAPALLNGFVDLDDDEAFVQNYQLRSALRDQIRWACTSDLLGAYQPLGRLVQVAEYRAFGLDPWGYHFTSVLWHAANAIALWVLIGTLLHRGMPERYARNPRGVWLVAGVVAALFAAHPLRVEAVAWATAQAFLPSAWFSLLSVLAYLYAHPQDGSWRWGWSLASLVLFACALASYAVPLALPVVLLVIDVYPLRRLGPAHWFDRNARFALLEKLPYLALSVLMGLVAIRARWAGEGLVSLEREGALARIAIACHSAAFYLVKTVWPFGLRAVYPMPQTVSWIEARFVLAAVAVVALSFAAWGLRRRAPAFSAAWLGYLLILLPNSGVVRNTTVLAADRYGYFAFLAWAVALAAGLCALESARLVRGPRKPSWKLAAVATALPLFVGLTFLCRAQCRTWHDSVALWSNVVAHNDRPDAFLESRLGKALAEAGRDDEAADHLIEAVRLAPKFTIARNKLGLLMVKRGQHAEALAQFAEAVRLEPTYVEARINFGYSLAQYGRLPEAEAQLKEAIRLQPNLVDARANLGAILSQQGRLAEAESQFAEAVRLAPDRPESRMNLGFVLTQQRKYVEAANQFSAAVSLQPDDPNAHHNLGCVLTELHRFELARAHFTEALRQKPDFPEARRGLIDLEAARARFTPRAN
jgi:Tfp pilus assembly protein PilF